MGLPTWFETHPPGLQRDDEILQSYARYVCFPRSWFASDLTSSRYVCGRTPSPEGWVDWATPYRRRVGGLPPSGGPVSITKDNTTPGPRGGEARRKARSDFYEPRPKRETMRPESGKQRKRRIASPLWSRGGHHRPGSAIFNRAGGGPPTRPASGVIVGGGGGVAMQTPGEGSPPVSLP